MYKVLLNENLNSNFFEWEFQIVFKLEYTTEKCWNWISFPAARNEILYQNFSLTNLRLYLRKKSNNDQKLIEKTNNNL